MAYPLHVCDRLMRVWKMAFSSRAPEKQSWGGENRIQPTVFLSNSSNCLAQSEQRPSGWGQRFEQRTGEPNMRPQKAITNVRRLSSFEHENSGVGLLYQLVETRLEFTQKAFPIKFSDKFLKYLQPPSQGKENDLSSQGNIQEASLFLKQENLVLHQEDLFFS